MKNYQRFIFILVILSIVSLFLEQLPDKNLLLKICTNAVDALLILILCVETIVPFAKTKYKGMYIASNRFSLIFTLITIILFAFSKFSHSKIITSNWAVFILFFRNLFTIFKAYTRMKKLSNYFERFTANPARNILLSFVFLILGGTLLLMVKISTVGEKGISFIDALFTATSAACVNGLIVKSTVGDFTLWGKTILILLMQVGGLGIMLLSFFMVFLFGKRISLQDKMLLSYMLSEDDSSSLRSTVLEIVAATFIFEGIGAVLLFIGFMPTLGFSLKNVYYSIFHSVSAFCNAGFALYDDSFESFRLNPLVLLTIAFLIIFGGIGFAVLKDLRLFFADRFASVFRKQKTPYKRSLSLNTRIVLILTAALLLAGTLLFYFFEHANTMASYGLAEQYLSAFFQSATLRTAGFTSVPFTNFVLPTYLFMCVLMFIGGNSGGTAGGIKVGTLSVLYATARAFFRGEDKVRLGRFQVSENKIKSSAVIFVAGIIVVCAAVFLLSISEKSARLSRLLFEVVSAITATGLTAGITTSLSVAGKAIIILLMFFGRLGALTIMAAAVFNKDKVNINLPQADIAIG
ncbi:potassium transporter TrkG [Treponema maltophilum]|uniref:potassium transporter TrkG n=1 Tax=Treponema maltophilum TaxID=51160 RepID=UPI003D8A3E17